VKRARNQLLKLLEKKQAIYTSILKEEKKKFFRLKQKIAKTKVTKKKLQLLALKEKKERKAALALAKKVALKEKKRVALAEKIALEEEQRIALAKKVALEEKQRIALAEKIALEEEQRIALAKKVAFEEKKLRALARQNNSSMTVTEEIAELEKLDFFESDQVGDELALFNQSKSKNSKGFKDFDKWFKYSLGYSTMLKNLEESNSGREAIKGTITMNPHSYYFLGTTMSFDINNYNNIYYQPDFSYSFGYSDWHQDTFSWNYSNYANNKFSPKEGESRFNFQSGNWEVSYKTKVKDVRLTAKAKYVPKSNSKKLYIKAQKVVLDDVMLSAQLKHNITTKQNRLTLSAKTFVYDNFFVSGSIYEYYKEDTIRAVDGEYAYSFGWSDSKPYHPSITYSNYYTPTRWDTDEGPKFNEGTLSVKFNLDF